jgi:hypothetical protein
MGEKRQWDESRSPQWRYILSKDSKERRNAEKRREKAERELASRSVDARERKKQAQEGHQENRKLKSKSGREILYSASPGGENSSYRNTEFIDLYQHQKNATKIFEIENGTNAE